MADTLQLVDMERLCVHEAREPARLHHVTEAIRREGVVVHPLLATPMVGERYLILDGAHRSGALERLSCPRVPVQIVSACDFSLYGWDHLVPVGSWLDGLRRDSAIRWAERPQEGVLLAQLQFDSGARQFMYAAASRAGLFPRLQIWHRIVAAYAERLPVTRIPDDEPAAPTTGMIRLSYPACTLAEIETVVMAGLVLPAGVTRFVVPRRLKNVCIPLQLLMDRNVPPGDWHGLAAGAASES